nr:GPGG-motif small membrane protein [Motilibacter deserti]
MWALAAVLVVVGIGSIVRDERVWGVALVVLGVALGPGAAVLLA